MSDLKINNITDRSGDRGPVIAGVSTVSSTGAFVVPVGPTTYRGNRGRGIFASGYTSASPLTAVKNIDFINIASTGNAAEWGEIITEGMGLAGGASNSIRGAYCGGFEGLPTNARISTIQALNIPTNGDIFDFGDLQWTSQQMSGAGNNTRGIYTNGYAYPNMSPVNPNNSLNQSYTMIEFMSSANRTDFGEIIMNAGCRDVSTCETPIRGYFAGGEGTGFDSPTHNKKITIKGFANDSESLNFGELSTMSQRGAAVGSGTRGVFVIGSAHPAITNTLEYITLTTLGNSLDFGDATSNKTTINNNAASNTIRGVYHIGRRTSPGDALTILDYITIATTGNAIEFGDLTTPTRDGCGLSDSHGGLE